MNAFYPVRVDTIGRPLDATGPLALLLNAVRADNTLRHGWEEERDELVAMFSAAGKRIDPNALVIPSFQMAKGRIDLAIFTKNANFAILVFTDYDVALGRPQKTGASTIGFDAVVLVDVTSTGHAAGRPWGANIAFPPTPAHIARFTYAPIDSTPALIYLAEELPSHTESPRTADEISSILLRRERAKRPLSVEAQRAFVARRAAERSAPTKHTTLTGAHIADALVTYLRDRSRAPASIIREARLGPWPENGVADCLCALPGALDLYEIKGETDQPARLASQVAHYDGVGSTCTLVTTTADIEKYVKRIPTHWGVLVAERKRAGTIRFTHHRRPEPNPNQNPQSVVQMMRTPMMSLALGLLGGPKHAGVDVMRERLVKAIDLERLTTIAARDCAFRYGEGGLRKTTVLQLGDPKAWPTVRQILNPVTLLSSSAVRTTRK